MKYKIKDIRNKILCGDTLTELKKFPDECVNLVITSPPYFQLRLYGRKNKSEIGLEATPQEYVKKLTIIFKEVKRVLKKSGSFWLNLSDVYGGSGAKRKKDYKGKYKTSGMDSFPTGRNRKINPKSLLGIPEQLMLSLIDDGWILRNKCLWIKSIIFKNKETIGGCMPTSCNDRFNQNAFEYFYFFTKNKKYYFNADKIRVPYKPLSEKRIQAGFSPNVSFDYTERLSKNPPTDAEYRYNLRKNKSYNTKKDSQKIGERKTKIPKYQAESFGSPRARYHRKTDLTADFFKKKGSGGNVNLPQKEKDFSKGKIPVCVWQYNTISVKGIHTALFPFHLLERPIKACLPKDGILLDPFCGFATSWLAQKLYQPKASFIGIELYQKYIDESYKRLAQQNLGI